MLHTKFLGNQYNSSGEDFEGFLPYMGVAAILVMLPRSMNKLSFPISMKAPNKIST